MSRDLGDRIAILDGLADGTLAPRDLAGLTRRDVAAIAQLGGAAYASKKFDQAARIFAGLEVIEPDVAIHALHRAEAEAQLGATDDAVASLRRYLDREEARPPADLARALLLRASLRAASDRAGAERDLLAARILEEGL